MGRKDSEGNVTSSVSVQISTTKENIHDISEDRVRIGALEKKCVSL